MAGGQATSIPLDRDRFGASWMNNGVQGGSKVNIVNPEKQQETKKKKEKRKKKKEFLQGVYCRITLSR